MRLLLATIALASVVAHGATVLNMTFDADTPPTVVDSSGSGNNGTLSGPDASTTDCFSGGCYDFAGAAEYIQVPDSDSLDCTNGVTISAWVQAVGLDEYPDSNYLEIVSKPGAYLLYIRQGGTLLFYLTGVTNMISSLQDNHALFDGAWHHIAASYDGSNAALYIDGRLNSSIAASGTISASANVLRIGNMFRGKMDEVKIQDAGITASGALALWKSYGTPRTTPSAYYVSSSTGDDANNGATNSPWKTLDHVYKQQFRPYAFIPGDSILLKRGDTFEGQVAPLWLDGTVGAPIIVGAYGTGANPKIYGDGRGFTWSAVAGYTGVYETIVGAGSWIHWVLEGTNLFGAAPAYVNVANWKTLASGNWAYPYAMSDRIWVRTTNDAAPANMTVFRYAVNAHRSTYVQIQDLDFESFGMARVENCANITITNVTTRYSNFSGVYCLVTTNCVLDHLTVDRAGESGIYLLSGLSNIVRYCTVSEIVTNVNGFPSGGGDRGGIGLYEGNANLVEHCQFLNTTQMSGAADVYYENDAVVRWNYAQGVNGWYPHGNNNLFYGNAFIGLNAGNAGSIDGCPTNHAAHNVMGYGKTGVATNNYLINNTFYGGGGIIAYPGGVLRNNIFYGNGSLITHRAYDAHGNGLEFADCDYNLFYDLPPYTATPRFTIWTNWPSGSEVLYQSFASYQTASGQDSHSVYGDPKFVSATPTVASQLHIQQTSPAVGAGVSYMGSGVDYAGRPTRNPPSIGAFEWYPTFQVHALKVGSVK